VYAAREAAIPGVSGALVADAARRSGGAVHYLAEREQLPAAVTAELRPGDLCLTLGAGDLDRASREILVLLGGGAA
jgi:UDP-N-acetylmuramate--alanine ligase